MRLACVHSGSEKAAEAFERLSALHDFASVAEADVVVALGGDGFMLHTFHELMGRDVSVYGMNRGTVGFLMNDYRPEGLRERISAASEEQITPLRATVTTAAGDEHELIAINEVSVIRSSVQAANLRVSVNDVERLERLVCDGLLVATPAGSTAYNLSARGPVLPLGAGLLAMTPLSPFRPRRWHGALLPHDARVTVEVVDAPKRPVAAGADSREVRDVVRLVVAGAPELSVRALFDPGHSLEDRILDEQFR